MQCKNILELKYPDKYPGLKYPRQKYPQTKISLTQNIPNKNILIPKYPMMVETKILVKQIIEMNANHWKPNLS